MSVLTDLIYGGSNAVAGLTEGAVNDAIAKYGADHPIAFPDTAYFFPTIYAATGVKVKTLGDLVPCVGVLKSLITNQEGQQALGLVVLDHLGNICTIVSLAQNNSNTGDVTGNQRHAQAADDGVGNEADTGVSCIRISGFSILQAFDDLSAHSGSQACVQCLTQVFLVGNEALEHTHASRQIAQSLDLYAGCSINSGETVGGIGECYFLICAVLGDGIIDCAFDQTGNCIGAAINKIS